MPTFRSQPSTDLASSIRRAVASRNLANNPDQINMVADQAAATTAQHLGLAEKARAEADAIRNAETARSDPKVSQEFASRSAGLTDAEGGRLMGHLRGALEQPSSNDDLDASIVGKEAQPFVMEPPNIKPGQRRGFESALASTIANRIATGHTNAEQLAKSGQDINKTAVQNAATDATSVPESNKLIAAVTGKVREPFKMTAQGAILNEEVGTANEDTATGRAYRASQAALAAQRNTAAGAPVAGDGSPSAAVPGGTGTKLMQEADSGAKYAVNEKTGRAWKATEKGWEPVLVTNLPKNLSKFGTGSATQSGREAIFTQRVITSANQAAKDLHNVVQLPLTASTGVFGGRKQGPGLLDAGREVLANKMTSQEAQQYNAMSTGFQRSLASIESAGLMPSGQLTHQMDAVQFKEGDTNLTKLHKLAQTRQIVESGMEVVLDNPRVSESEKSRARQILESVQKAVPFTHEDLIELGKAQTINNDATMADVLKARGGSSASVPAVNAKGWKLMKDAKGNQAYVSPDGKQFEEAK